MNKETLYKKVQDLFPDELSVGDVVERDCGNSLKYRAEFLYYLDNKFAMIKAECPKGEIPHNPEEVLIEDLKRIRKNITLPMILRKFEEVREFHTHLDINSKGYLTYWESIDKDKTKQEDWQLRKDGKDLSLYDQSIELIKLVYEVLNDN